MCSGIESMILADHVLVRAEIPLFKGCSEIFYEEVCRMAKYETFPKDTTIFLNGDKGVLC